MKPILLLSFCLFYFVMNGQSEDYNLLELRKGSVLFGKIINKKGWTFSLETNSSDTLYIKKTSVKRIYLIEDMYDERGDLPVLTRGKYKTFFVGIGGGFERINPFENPFRFPALSPIITYRPITVIKMGGSIGYQFNKYFGLGVGANYYYFKTNRLFAVDGALHPYFQAKFDYTPPRWGNESVFLIANLGNQTEFIGGVSFVRPRRTYKVGVAFYKSYEAFKQETHLSLQAGIQF